MIGPTSHSANMAATPSHTRFSKNLKDARQRLGWSLEQAAEAIGTSKGYLSELERGLRPMPPGKKLVAIADAMGMEMEDLFVLGAATKPATVPVVGYVSAGSSLVQYAEGQGPFDYVEAPKLSTPSTVAAAVRGVSLGPAFDEAILFYDDVRSPVTEDLHGRLCVVGLIDGSVLVKILRPGEQGRYHLISNSAEEPLWNKEVIWAARVTEVRPR